MVQKMSGTATAKTNKFSRFAKRKAKAKAAIKSTAGKVAKKAKAVKSKINLKKKK